MTPHNSADDGAHPPKRITVKAARKMLGMVARNYSDADLEQLLDHLYGVAGAAFEIYLDTGTPKADRTLIDDPDLTE